MNDMMQPDREEFDLLSAELATLEAALAGPRYDAPRLALGQKRTDLLTRHRRESDELRFRHGAELGDIDTALEQARRDEEAGADAYGAKVRRADQVRQALAALGGRLRSAGVVITGDRVKSTRSPVLDVKPPILAGSASGPAMA